MIEAVIFDLDGTLLDTEGLSDKAMLAVLDPFLNDSIRQERKDAGFRLPWELKKQIIGLRGTEWSPMVLQYASRIWNVDCKQLSASELFSGWEIKLSDLCSEVEPCPGAIELVNQFAQELLPMGIATSSWQNAVNKKMSRFPTFQKISVIVTGDHPAVRMGKPAPDIYFEAARQLQVQDMAKCLVFEDSLMGVRSGKAAGCIVVAIPDPRFSEEEREIFRKEADLVLDSLLDFSWDALYMQQHWIQQEKKNHSSIG